MFPWQFVAWDEGLTVLGLLGAPWNALSFSLFLSALSFFATCLQASQTLGWRSARYLLGSWTGYLPSSPRWGIFVQCKAPLGVSVSFGIPKYCLRIAQSLLRPFVARSQSHA